MSTHVHGQVLRGDPCDLANPLLRAGRASSFDPFEVRVRVRVGVGIRVGVRVGIRVRVRVRVGGRVRVRVRVS